MSDMQEWVGRRAEVAGLGPAGRRVVEILARQPHLASYASTSEMAERAGVNVATVVRTARQLGCSGWPDLRLELRSPYLASPSVFQMLNEHDTSPGDPITDAIRRAIENLEILSRSVDVSAVQAAAKTTLSSRHTLAVGSGTFAAPGVQSAHAGTSMGVDVHLDRRLGT